ncbi:hypothetical protein C3F09_09935 [candidate division GN15 bacterium]|uniref:Type IX secretion system protein PorV domain-containing protein n=1 Tax=candidate division GN15 bacterium TaxID=2072418 RepID=A0A855X476_9BACT|nr:MAG: hypothetical protein C3F09_09935 [candidate division GN15 bacterium]
MKKPHVYALVWTTLTLIALVTSSFADISNEAVLYLRINPSARAAGMGNAFVAIANDASATHFNPAGLGADPFASTWIEMRVPDEYRPLKAFAPLKARGGTGQGSYDIWAITGKGLARYDGRKWHSGEVLSTRTDDTIEKLVSKYFGETDQVRLDSLIARVASANSKMSLADLQKFRDGVLATLPADYKERSAVEVGFDSLISAYPLCRINWDRVIQARQAYTDGMKDSTLSEREIDRITVGLEQAITRFVPETITLPYNVNFEGEPTSLASTGDAIVVGTASGAIRYNGKNWQGFGVNSGLPSSNVLCLAPVGASIFIGTDKGLCRFNGLTVEAMPAQTNPPTGVVSAIGGENNLNVFAVVDNDLYHFDGTTWSNTMPYQVVLDDTPEKVAAKFSIYGTAAEQTLYRNKLVKSFDIPSTGDSGAVASDSTVNAAIAVNMKAGSLLMVPYLAEIKGQVSSIAVGLGKTVWLGTSNGVLVLDRSGWSMPGYRDTVTAAEMTVQQVAEWRKNLTADEAAAYQAQLKQLNDLTTDNIPQGTKIRIWRNPAAAPVHNIGQFEQAMLVSTDAGLLEYTAKGWERSDKKNFGSAPSADFSQVKGSLWLAGNNEIVTRSAGRKEVLPSYFKWLPELASDLYYTYVATVFPTQNLGTFGFSFKYMSYGNLERTDETGKKLGEFLAYDMSAAVSWGASLTNKLKGGITGKFIYSHLSDVGAGAEKGGGTASDFALDFGLLYFVNSRLNFGMALTNIGPKIFYIDAGQPDDLPRNLAFGVAYKAINGEYLKLTVSTEANKTMAKLGDGLSTELKQVVLNTGAEMTYLDLISFRGGYIYDQEGDVKVGTLGVGLAYKGMARIDFAYVPSQGNSPLGNTLLSSASFRF